MASAEEELLMFRRLFCVLYTLLHPPSRTLASNPPPPPTPSSNPVLIPNDLPPPPRTPSSNRPSPPPPPAPSSNPAFIANDLIREILKFLPVKSLMRFKCVSKDWLSIITDPSFTSSYAGGFRGPVLFRPRGISEHPFMIIHYLSIHDTGSTPSCEASHHSTVDHGGQSLAHTAVVNGLICFFDARGNTSWLYNIATRERVQLPVSSPSVPPPEDVARRFRCSCHLGFDPVSKLYKLVKLSTIYDRDIDGSGFILRPATSYFEILTIGVDSCWRTIDSPPASLQSSPFLYQGHCVDGVLYELQQTFTNNCFLTAFHIADERFLSIPLPPDFENRPSNFDDRRFGSLQLPMFFPGPGPVLTSFGDRSCATLHIDRYSYGGVGEEEGREPEGRWDTDILTLPRGHLRPRVIPSGHLRPIGILPNRKVLLADYHAPEPALLCLYDPIKREFENLAVINWTGPGNKFTRPGDFCFVEENIVSLKCFSSVLHPETSPAHKFSFHASPQRHSL